MLTGACLILFLEYGYPIFVVLFWLKLATLALVFYFISIYKKKEFYYYHNLGLSKTVLWTATLGFDFLFFLLVLTQSIKFK